jgi:hypothetical protein
MDVCFATVNKIEIIPIISNARSLAYLGAFFQPLAIASDSVQNHRSPFSGEIAVI